MKEEFQKNKLSKLDNISITAFRIITILNLLLKKPCNDKEINNEFKNELGEERELSKDTICIYLNTLRFLGCEISRPTKKNGYKYILKSPPFKLHLSKDEINTLAEIRKFISTLGDWKTALETDRIFNNLLNYFTPETKKFFMSAKKTALKREVSVENFFQEIKQLEMYCKHQKIITLVYDSPASGGKNITIKAEKLSIENGAYYLWGYNNKIEASMSLRIDRILDIKSVNLHSTDEIKPMAIIVKYKLKDSFPLSSEISENESIISKANNELLIEAAVTNKFNFFQKVLSYGDKCTVLHPEEIRSEVENKLKTIRQLYNEKDSV